MRSRGLRSSWSGSFRVGQVPVVGARVLFYDCRCWRMPSVGARWFRFASHPGWQELAYLGGAVGFGGEFSSLIRAVRGVRGDTPPARRDQKIEQVGVGVVGTVEAVQRLPRGGGNRAAISMASAVFHNGGGTLLLVYTYYLSFNYLPDTRGSRNSLLGKE